MNFVWPTFSLHGTPLKIEFYAHMTFFSESPFSHVEPPDTCLLSCWFLWYISRFGSDETVPRNRSISKKTTNLFLQYSWAQFPNSYRYLIQNPFPLPIIIFKFSLNHCFHAYVAFERQSSVKTSTFSCITARIKWTCECISAIYLVCRSDWRNGCYSFGFPRLSE